ncbi:hypothetical protein VNO78_03757 [Psophocarpus tetragonolobus]|uniref:Uncharacterized protein n=1 Tax=Psophocarpus tetragonolobus TaxID=3891 RepID=A0AAN9XX85_PSOTE
MDTTITTRISIIFHSYSKRKVYTLATSDYYSPCPSLIGEWVCYPPIRPKPRPKRTGRKSSIIRVTAISSEVVNVGPSHACSTSEELDNKCNENDNNICKEKGYKGSDSSSGKSYNKDNDYILDYTFDAHNNT